MKKNIFVFGSTGSIGIQTLDVLSKSKTYNVIGLSCNSNSDLLFEQIKLLKPALVAINNIDLSHGLIKYCDVEYKDGTEISCTNWKQIENDSELEG